MTNFTASQLTFTKPEIILYISNYYSTDANVSIFIKNIMFNQITSTSNFYLMELESQIKGNVTFENLTVSNTNLGYIHLIPANPEDNVII